MSDAPKARVAIDGRTVPAVPPAPGPLPAAQAVRVASPADLAWRDEVLARSWALALQRGHVRR